MFDIEKWKEDLNTNAIFTTGLPGVDNAQRYIFRVLYSKGLWDVYLPGDYVGRDQLGYPSFPEQVDLLTKYGAYPSSDGCWTFSNDSTFNNFLKAIESVLHNQ